MCSLFHRWFAMKILISIDAKCFLLVFNVGEYRRHTVKFYADKAFFDPDNTEAVALRKYNHIFLK